MRTATRISLAVSLTVAAAAVRGQTPPAPEGTQPAPTFRTRVELVRVDVTVIGRGGRELVADLRPGDFLIEEDGIPQKVETVQFVRLNGTRASDGAESLAIRSPQHAAVEAAREDVRLFAIFLDDYHVARRPAITLPLRKALRHLVDQFGPNDLVAVMDPLTPLSHLEFTRSLDDLRRRVEEFEGRLGVLFPVRSPLEEAQHGARNVWEVRAGVTLSALGSLVTHLGGLREGRKSVLFVSQGPPLGRPGSANEQRLRDVLQAANRGNVTVHVLDPRPLGASPLRGGDALFRLHHETGGRAIINVNDPRHVIGRIIDDASAYYLVGYAPSRAMADGRFHKIDVKVNRRGVQVLARSGYWAPRASEMMPDASRPPAEPGLVEALRDLVEPREGRDVAVWIGASRGSGGATRLTLSWEPREHATAKAPERLIVVPIHRGVAADDQARTIAASSARNGERLATFDVAPQTTLILQLTAQDADGAVVDQWQQPVDAPHLASGPVALGTPRYLRARSAFDRRAMDSGTDPPPAASRRFRPTDHVVVDVECYADPACGPVTAQLLNGRGDRLTELPGSTAGGRTRFTLPLTSVAPGTYVLRVDARAGPHSVAQRSAFQLIP